MALDESASKRDVGPLIEVLQPLSSDVSEVQAKARYGYAFERSMPLHDIARRSIADRFSETTWSLPPPHPAVASHALHQPCPVAYFPNYRYTLPETREG